MSLIQYGVPYLPLLSLSLSVTHSLLYCSFSFVPSALLKLPTDWRRHAGRRVDQPVCGSRAEQQRAVFPLCVTLSARTITPTNPFPLLSSPSPSSVSVSVPSSLFFSYKSLFFFLPGRQMLSVIDSKWLTSAPGSLRRKTLTYEKKGQVG